MALQHDALVQAWVFDNCGGSDFLRNTVTKVFTFSQFRVGLIINRRSFDRRTLLGVASVVPSGLKGRSRFPVLDVSWT